MRTIDKRRYDMLVRVSAFGAAHRDLFPASALGGRIFAALGSAVHELSAYVTTEASGQSDAREGALSKSAARASLRGALEDIGRTARALALDTPGLGGKFRLPGGRNDHDLATSARMFIADAAPLGAAFVSHGLPSTFLADLRTRLVAFERATRDHVAARETHIVANAGIHEAIQSAQTALKRLDAIVPNRLRDNASLRAAWASARRVARSRPADQPVIQPPPPPVPTTVPTAPSASVLA